MADDNAGSVVPQVASECIGTDERNGDEDWIESLLTCDPYEFGYRFIGADRDDRLRRCFHDIEERRLDRGRIALEASRSDQRHVALGERDLDACETSEAEDIILVEDRNP